MMHNALADAVVIPVHGGEIAADLRRPDRALGLVIFAHGSGSSRFSSRNRAVADYLDHHRFATLLLDLLTPAEERVDLHTAQHRFDIALLSERVVQATDWAGGHQDLRALPIGYFGASTGAAAALIGAAERPDVVRAVVSRGGRPDLAGDALPRVQAPARLIVGGDDGPVIEMNRDAKRRMTGLVEIDIVPGATHLFEEPGTLEQVMSLASDWFARFLVAADVQDGPAPAEPAR
jgi:pimeloyl-ACP methyl ester carboxylesterase